MMVFFSLEFKFKCEKIICRLQEGGLWVYVFVSVMCVSMNVNVNLNARRKVQYENG